jgi:hypothetical protein
MRRTAWLTVVLLAVAQGWIGEAQVIESVRITAPPLLTFDVADVDVITYASGGVFTVSFDQGVLRSGRAVRISVRAEGDLDSPGGPRIPAAALSWTTSGASNGIGVNGTLSKSQYRTVFEGVAGVTSGRVDVTWSLELGNRNVKAGVHTGQLRWRIETFNP